MVKRDLNIPLHSSGTGRACGCWAVRAVTSALQWLTTAIVLLLCRRPTKTAVRDVGLVTSMDCPCTTVLSAIHETLTAAGKVMAYYRGYTRIAIACNVDGCIVPLAVVDPRFWPFEGLLVSYLRALSAWGQIVFAPVPEAASFIHVLWLHDVPQSRLSALPKRSLIVESGEHRYDCHIYVGAAMEPSEITRWQTVLSAIYGSSRGAVARDTYRALPIFAGKHPARLREDIVCSGIFWFETYWMKIREQTRLQREALSRVRYKGAHNRWAWDANRTAADVRYAVKLLGLGYDEGEVADIILAESEDIVLREGRNLRSYLTRIVSVAQRKHAQRTTGRLV